MIGNDFCLNMAKSQISFTESHARIILGERTSSYAPLALQIYKYSLMLMATKVDVTGTSHIPSLTWVGIHLPERPHGNAPGSSPGSPPDVWCQSAPCAFHLSFCLDLRLMCNVHPPLLHVGVWGTVKEKNHYSSEFN